MFENRTMKRNTCSLVDVGCDVYSGDVHFGRSEEHDGSVDSCVVDVVKVMTVQLVAWWVPEDTM